MSQRAEALPSRLVVSAAALSYTPSEAEPAERAQASERSVAGPRRAEIQDWMIALASGNRSALEPLYAALWPIVRRVCARMLPNRADADDAAQDALVRLAGRVSEFDPSRDAVAWVIGIAVFECRTVRKRTSRRREDGLDAIRERTTEHPDPESDASERELNAHLEEVLEQLPASDVEVIRAALRDERSVENGAVAGATFRKRLQRAMKRLRDAWRSNHGDE